MTTLALAVVLWLVGFDIIYALQDYEFDKSHGLRSLVVAWGQKKCARCRVSRTHGHVRVLLAFGLLCQFRIAYLIGWFIIVGWPRAGTLDCAPAQSELDQCGLLPP